MATRLTPIQMKIANMTADGERPFEIAGKLNMTTEAVRNQIHRSLRKLGLKSSIQLSAAVWRRRVKKIDTSMPSASV